MAKLKCFCVNFLISWRSGNAVTKIAVVFTSSLLSVCYSVVFMVTGCVFQKQCMDGICSLAHYVNPDALILLCPC